MLSWVPLKTNVIQQRSSSCEKVLVLLVVKTALHVHPFSQRTRRTRNSRRSMQLLIFLQILKSLLPRFRIWISNDPLESNRIQSKNTLLRQPLTPPCPPLPLFTTHSFIVTSAFSLAFKNSIILVILVLQRKVKFKLLALLGHLLPLRSHVRDPAAELAILGILLGHVDMAMILVVLRQPLIHVLKVKSSAAFITRRSRLGILLNRINKLAQWLAQHLFQKGQCRTRNTAVQQTILPSRHSCSSNGRLRIPNNLERRFHIHHQSLQCQCVNPRGGARC
mmetsp:Transcript_17205/g.37121  ORF Transcript_17205/g.37121 Transcript_17205/m.37121 type:complete len:278 (-) Transcript_17205:86-919(-)